MRFWVGGYTADGGGTGEGIGQLIVGDADASIASGALALVDGVTPANSPTWLTAHPTLDVVYAALEFSGRVQAYHRSGDDTLVPFGASVEVAGAACHLAIDATTIWVTCWNEGQVFRIPLGADGALGTPRLLAAVPDPYAEHVPGIENEVRPSRGHQTLFLPNGLTATTDMGHDVVRIWRGDAVAADVVLPKGSGPRHALWHPSGHLYVLTELSCEVFVVAPDVTGAWRVVSGTPLSPTTAVDVDYAAGIVLSADARFVYAGVRGSNAIAVLDVQGSGDRLQPRAFADAQVDWPRFHDVFGDTMFIAGQLSSDVVSVPLDDRTGIPGRARHRVAVPSPTVMLLA